MKGGSEIVVWVLVAEDAKGGTAAIRGSADPRGLRGYLSNRRPPHATLVETNEFPFNNAEKSKMS